MTLNIQALRRELEKAAEGVGRAEAQLRESRLALCDAWLLVDAHKKECHEHAAHLRAILKKGGT
jgi:hypothetical protein